MIFHPTFSKSLVAFFTLLLLTACAKPIELVDEKAPTVKVKEVKELKEDKATKEKPPALNETERYQEVITRYQDALGVPLADLDFDKVSSWLSWTVQYDYVYSGAYFTIVDLTGDGVKELAIGLRSKRYYTLIDLYTISAKGDLVRLVDPFRENGPEVGERVTLWSLKDGRFSLESVGHYRFYHLDSDRTAFVFETETESRPTDYLDLLTLPWVRLEKGGPTTVPDKSAQEVSKGPMNLEEIQAGNFASVAGEWASSKHHMTIDASGGVDDNGKIIIDNRSHIEDGLLHTGVIFDIHGAGISFAPAGVPFPDSIMDGETDLSQDRILIAQAKSSPDAVYYRVK